MTDTDTGDAYICKEANSPIYKIVIKSQIQPMRMDTGISYLRPRLFGKRISFCQEVLYIARTQDPPTQPSVTTAAVTPVLAGRAIIANMVVLLGCCSVAAVLQCCIALVPQCCSAVIMANPLSVQNSHSGPLLYGAQCTSGGRQCAG